MNKILRILLRGAMFVILFASIGVQSGMAETEGNVDNFRLPFEGTVDITQGPRCSYSHNDFWGIQNREAIDFNVRLGTPIYATESGQANYIDRGVSGGKTVLILHDNGLKSVYAHLDGPEGETFPRHVERGELIGFSGNSGHVPEHLHFAVLSGNPDLNYISGEPVPIWQMSGITWDSKYESLLYPASGECLPDGFNDGKAQWPSGGGVIPTGTKRLVQRDFTVERTNPKVTEELQFAVDIANDVT